MVFGAGAKSMRSQATVTRLGEHAANISRNTDTIATYKNQILDLMVRNTFPEPLQAGVVLKGADAYAM